MSRQYNEYMEGKFEIYGETYELVEPSNFDELIKALEIKETIQNYLSGLMHDEDPGVFTDYLQEQEDYINAYLENIGEFDNSLLISNINYLAKKHNLRIGDVERLLGISAGYISRTAKENSAKKLSIDVVWKIAKLFEVSVNSIINSDLRMPRTNTELLINFLGKLFRDTKEDILKWSFEGGFECDAYDRYLELGMVSEVSDEETDEYTYRYYPRHLNNNMKWYVAGEIICSEKFVDNKDLVMIPYAKEGCDSIYGVDCFFLWKQGKKWQSQEVFFSPDAPMSDLEDYAISFYNEVVKTQFDATVAPEVKSILSAYLKKGVQ